MLREYAAGNFSWTTLRDRKLQDYVQVLGGLGELGLRPPIAPMEGPNVAARERGRTILQRQLKDHRER